MKYKNSILIPILYMAFIFILSSIPATEDNKMAGVYIQPTLQNILHIPLFGLLAFLWMRFFSNKGFPLHKTLMFSLTIVILYAIFDELHQYFVPGRYASLGDLIFNIVGCVVFAFYYAKTTKRCLCLK